MAARKTERCSKCGKTKPPGITLVLMFREGRITRQEVFRTRQEALEAVGLSE